MSFTEAFYQNFIEDDRWLYLTRGLGMTLLITFLAVLVGIVLGFVIAVIRSTHDRNGSFKILNAICSAYLTIIRGTPVVIQLMIVWFVIFGPYSNNKVLAAVIAFGLNSAAYVAEILRAGIMSIDQGQFEAGRSLGFNYIQTMRYIILPQAFKNVLPSLANEVIVLLKETSVCGFIALNDLTRGGEIIRSITFARYLPLLTVAAIYLALVMILTSLVGKLERRLRVNER